MGPDSQFPAPGAGCQAAFLGEGLHESRAVQHSRGSATRPCEANRSALALDSWEVEGAVGKAVSGKTLLSDGS